LKWRSLKKKNIIKELIDNYHMKRFPVVFDLETKHTFREFSEPEKLGVTVLSLFDYNSGKESVYTEKELSRAFRIFENASYLVGYNINGFDLPVLRPYYAGDISHFPTLDILEDIRVKIGHRISLNDVASTTLNKKKSGHGLQAIDFYKEGKWDELKKYCLDDTLITKELFDFGLKFKEIHYMTPTGRSVVRVDWSKYMEESGNSETHMTLPF